MRIGRRLISTQPHLHKVVEECGTGDMVRLPLPPRLSSHPLRGVTRRARRKAITSGTDRLDRLDRLAISQALSSGQPAATSTRLSKNVAPPPRSVRAVLVV